MSTTFSPDSIHGGPSIATLSGACGVGANFSGIDRGDVFFINLSQNSRTKYTFTFDKPADQTTGRIAIAAEAVTLTHDQLHHHGIVHIPVVVFGRTVVNLKHKEGQNQKFYGGDTAWISNSDLMVYPNTKEGYQITFLHPEENIPSNTFTNKGTPTEVFVEPYYSYTVETAENSEVQVGDNEALEMTEEPEL